MQVKGNRKRANDEGGAQQDGEAVRLELDVITGSLWQPACQALAPPPTKVGGATGMRGRGGQTFYMSKRVALEGAWGFHVRTLKATSCCPPSILQPSLPPPPPPFPSSPTSPTFPRLPPPRPQIPLVFSDKAQYRRTFEPLLLEEARGAVRSEFDEAMNAGRGWPVVATR